MDSENRKKEDRRIEFRVNEEDKALYEYACELEGYRSLSEFVRAVMSKEANRIVEDESRILASKRDREVFFNALMGKERKPNDALLSAFKMHNKILDK